MSSRIIRTVDDLIAYFGGLTPMASVLGTSPQQVVHWRRKGYIPAISYKVHRRRLEEANRHLKVSDDLWGFLDTEQLDSPQRRRFGRRVAAE